MLGAATLVYGALVAASLVGGPLKPQQLLPFPDLVDNLPLVEPQPTGAKPGAKNSPGENRPVGSGAKKINTTTTADASGAPVASSTPTATPTVGPTSAAPTPQPSADPTKPPVATPHPPATPAPSATPTPGQTQPVNTEGSP